MGLEEWDPDRRKWVLYRSGKQHGDDCDRYPLQKIPRRIFLDTNVVNLLVKHSERIFEQVKVSEHLDNTACCDIEALMHVFYFGARAVWDIFASKKVLHEIDQTINIALREDLLDYAVQLVGVADEESAYADDLGRRLVDAPFVSALRDAADRELLGNAVGLRCDIFCTCDRRTIVRKRDNIKGLPIQVLTPVEWWSHVKPWAALWG